MSYHILHITTPNCALSTDRGLLFCKHENETNMIALLDLKAIIVATFGVSFTNSCLAKLLENNVIILHCNNKYKPVGWSLPLEKIVRTKVFYNQVAQNKDFERDLWRKVLFAKVLNQADNLDIIGAAGHNLFNLINKPLMNEANIARQYWQNYFPLIGNAIKRERQGAETFENVCLNYGYAVIQSLIYRSIIIHGLIGGLGIHHIGKYDSTPLVYDLMEPYRPFIDFYFYKFTQDNPQDYSDNEIKFWMKYLADCIKNYRIKIKGMSYKIVDSVDIYIEKIANAYKKFDTTDIFLPNLSKQYFAKDTQRNREYEE